jgi:DNA helicase II / ATP-dependent DNA helicase PcrA
LPEERHGEETVLIQAQHWEEEILAIKRIIADFRHSSYQSLGIICKTQAQSQFLIEQIQNKDYPVHLLTAQSTKFKDGIIVTTHTWQKG